jgi:DNA-binding GntR family transcriptional regulator
MYRLYGTLLSCRESGDIAGCMRAHRDLHFTLYAAAGMATLSDLISTVWVGTSPYVVFLYMDPESGLLEPPYIGRGRTVDEHLTMIDALRADDPAAVRAAVVRDIPLGEEIIFKYLLADEEGQSAAKPANSRSSTAAVLVQ